jgi:MFS family permease
MRAHSVAGNLRLLYLFWFLRDFQIWIPVWIVFLTIEKGFSLTQVTGAEGLFLVGVVVLEVPTGAVADRWGRSISLGLGALCLGLAVLLFALATTFPLLLTSFMLWSLASTLMSGADMALLYDTLRETGGEASFERIAGRGIACTWAGAGIATLVGGPVAALLDIRATIFIGAATCVVTAAIAFLLHEPPHTRRQVREDYFRSIRAAFGEAWDAADVRAVILLSGTAFAALEGAHYLVQPYLVDRGLGVGVLFSVLQAPLILMGAAGALAAGRVSSGRISFALIAVPVIGAGAYLVLAVAPGMNAYAAFPLMFALGSCLRPIASGFVNRRIGSERRATVLSINGMVESLVLAALAPGLGFVTDRWGIDWAFAMGGALTFGIVAVFGPALVVTGRRREAPAAIAAGDA